MGMGDMPGGVTVGPAPQAIPSVPTLQETLAEAKPAPVALMMVVGPLIGVHVTPSNPTLQATGPPVVPTVGPVMVEVPSTQIATPSVPTLHETAAEASETEELKAFIGCSDSQKINKAYNEWLRQPR